MVSNPQITWISNYIVNIYEYESLIICVNLRNLWMGLFFNNLRKSAKSVDL